MTIGCNIWMICLKLNWFLRSLSRMLQFSQFVWTPCYSVWDVFNNFLLTDATDRSKISSDQKHFFIALSLYPLSFFANTPFKKIYFCDTTLYIHTHDISFFLFNQLNWFVMATSAWLQSPWLKKLRKRRLWSELLLGLTYGLNFRI